MRYQRMAVGLAVLGLGSIIAPVASAVNSANADAITYVNQSRSVSVSSSVQGFGRGGTSPSPTTDQQSQSQQAGGFGDFTGSQSAMATIGAASPVSMASAGQQSSLGAAGLTASGSVSANSIFNGNGSGNAVADSIFQVTFDVPAALAYTFTANLNGEPDLNEPGNPMATLTLSSVSGANVFAPIQAINVVGFSSAGTLAAGEYALSLSSQATSNDESNNFMNYAISLTTAAPVSVSMPIGDPTVVPLPPAYLSAGAVLVGLGAAGFVRRRWNRWVRSSLA